MWNIFYNLRNIKDKYDRIMNSRFELSYMPLCIPPIRIGFRLYRVRRIVLITRDY